MQLRAACSKPLTYWLFWLALAGCGASVLAQKPANTVAGGQKRAYSMDKKVVVAGQLLFQNNCSPCHNFLQKGIGPNLSRVTADVSPIWLKQFIRNAPGQISRGDARATRLFEEYKQVMPAFPTLKEAELTALLAYLHANHKAELPAAQREALGVGLNDPIPAKPTKSGLRLRLDEVLTAPATALKAPLARINKMAVLPGQPDRVSPDRVSPDRVFIEDLRGILYELLGNELRVFMDLRKERPGFIHSPGLGVGFASFAFHPDFYRNGLFYTTHTEKADAAPADFVYADSIRVAMQGVLMEWNVSNPAGAVFSGSGRELMRVNLVSAIHGMQEITFNPLARPESPDYGLLYLGIGDGGATEEGYSQLCNDNSRIWGSVLRINPLGSNSRNGRYGIPPANPYAQDQDPATLGEIFCRGFRNPNRMSWTPDGKMLIADIGQHNAEEINIGTAGADYGWPEREGTFRINPRGDMALVYALPPDDSTHRYSYPVVQYDHDEGSAISGGFVYAGMALPLLQDKYVFNDIVNGRVFYVESSELKPGVRVPIQELELELAGKLTTFKALCGGKKTDLRMGIGLNQDLYLYTKADGKLYKVTGCAP